LAFACSVSLTEMRVVTAAVSAITPFSRGTATCASCRRQTVTLTWGTDRVAVDKCTHCSRPIDPGEKVEVVDTDRFHRRCWRRLTTDETIRDTKMLSRRSWDLIRRSRELMGLSPLEARPEA
jgi:hypothetical protein